MKRKNICRLLIVMLASIGLCACGKEGKKEEVKEKTIDEITSKFGKNSILKASALLEDSTVKDRNNKIGGHNA